MISTLQGARSIMIPSLCRLAVILSTLASVIQLVYAADNQQHPHPQLPQIQQQQQQQQQQQALPHTTSFSFQPSPDLTSSSSPPAPSSSSSVSSSRLVFESATKVDNPPFRTLSQNELQQHRRQQHPHHHYRQKAQQQRQQQHQQKKDLPKDESAALATSSPQQLQQGRRQQQQQEQQRDLATPQKPRFRDTASAKDIKTLDVLEQAFLKNAGLSERPRGNSRSAVPQYMLDLYKEQVERPGGPSQFVDLKGKGLTEANTVRSFFHNDIESDKCQPPYCHRVSFDVSSIREGETLTDVQLRIFVDSPHLVNGDDNDDNNNNNNNKNDRLASTAKPQDGAVSAHRGKKKTAANSNNIQKQRIEIHEIVRPAFPDGEVISRLIDTRTILPKHSDSWQTFDIHPAVLKWKRGSKHNHGLEVRIFPSSPISSSSSSSSSPPSSSSSSSSSKDSSSSLSSSSTALSSSSSNEDNHHHIRLRRSADLPDTDWVQKRPLLVVFTNDGSTPLSSSSSSFLKSRQLNRGKRNANKNNNNRDTNNRKNKRRNRRKKNKNRKRKRRRRKKKGNKNMCKRHHMYVDFTDVGWDDWIIAPPGYPAYYCDGECPTPLPLFTKASNHALIQARAYSVKPEAVPMVCCVPVELESIPMLYRDEKNATKMQTYPNMSVKECGCK